MICPKCGKKHGLIADGSHSCDEKLCWSCMYYDDIEREIMRGMNMEVDEDCGLLSEGME